MADSVELNCLDRSVLHIEREYYGVGDGGEVWCVRRISNVIW